MPWWIEQIAIGTALWSAATAAVTTHLLRRQRARDARDAAIVSQALAQDISVYEAARFTGDSGTEIAVWLLLEGGHVHVARDGRIRPTIATLTRPRPALDDPAQVAVLDFLRGHPHGSKLHEIKDDSTCRRLCETDPDLRKTVAGLGELRRDGLRRRAIAAAYLIPVLASLSAVLHATATSAEYRSFAEYYWFIAPAIAIVYLPVSAARLFPRRRNGVAEFRLYQRCEDLVGTRFAGLGHEEERKAAALYRQKAPAYSPNRSRRAASSSTATADTGCGSSASCGAASSCGSGSSCGSSCS
ncbi:hypothetical protein [Yinghuangia sp. YIM S09857]|uniref:hypothetical protein n=1 Tax=Yinghuangia sp. YIM S09857 TaxID=3436929 RepID=UPI003F5348E8